MLYLATKWWRHQVNAVLDIFGHKCRHGSCHVAYMFYNTHPLLPHTHSCHRRSSQTNMYPTGSSPPLSSESYLKYKAEETSIRFYHTSHVLGLNIFLCSLDYGNVYRHTKIYFPWSFSRKWVSIFGIYLFMLHIPYFWCFFFLYFFFFPLLSLLLLVIKFVHCIRTPIRRTLII